MKGITFGNLHTYDDLQLILTTKEIGAPTVKSKRLTLRVRTVCLCTLTTAGLVRFARYRLGNTWLPRYFVHSRINTRKKEQRMMDTIIVAAISLIGTLAGSYFANSKTIALLSYRLEQLERKVEKHNSVVERTFQLENNVQTAFSRIDEIRGALHEHQEA